jgi:perosamine synthetase
MGINFFNTHISESAIRNVTEVLRSGWISEGNKVREFEARLETDLGLVNPIAVNSGTAALQLALVVAGVKSGDEVILPAQTFIATAMAILAHGAKPIFADIQYDTGNISPDFIRKRITEKTKAIIPVHWGGYPCDLDEINSIANEYKLVVIEDAAHALGAMYKKRAVGSISPFTAFSFQAIKHLTTGDGGALCCLERDNYLCGKIKRWFGIDRAHSKPSMMGERIAEISEIGYKWHLNDLGAAVGLGNLEDFPARFKRRQQIAHYYRNILKNVTGLKLLDYNDDRKSSYWLFTMLVERRTDFIMNLKDHGVPASVVHLRIDRHPIFGGMTCDMPNQEKFNDKQIAIPVHDGLTDKDVEKIVKCIKKGW